MRKGFDGLALIVQATLKRALYGVRSWSKRRLLEQLELRLEAAATEDGLVAAAWLFRS
jgi:hypothetical protein